MIDSNDGLFISKNKSMSFSKLVFLCAGVCLPFFGLMAQEKEALLMDSVNHAPKIKVTILSATALDNDANCGDRTMFEFYSKVYINGNVKHSTIAKGTQINPNWTFEGLQSKTGKNEVRIWLFDQDKMGCGNRDDVVDITPEGIESGLILSIDNTMGRIYQLVEQAIQEDLVVSPRLKLGIFGYHYSNTKKERPVKKEYKLLGNLNETIESVGNEDIGDYFFQRGQIKFKIELL